MTGDRLLEVDGSNLRGVSHQQAVECLKRTGEVHIHTHTHKLRLGLSNLRLTTEGHFRT